VFLQQAHIRLLPEGSENIERILEFSNILSILPRR
jgi:hypothetical protein